MASGFQDVSIITLLLEDGVDVNAKETLMPVTARRKATVELLLKSGADVNTKGAGGNIALMAAALSGVATETIKTLLSAGAHVNDKNSIGRTPLILAAAGDIMINSAINVFLEPCTDAVERELNRLRVQILIAVNDQLTATIIDLLLKAGADVKAKDNDGHDALWHLNQKITFSDIGRKYITDLILNASRE